VPSSFSLQFIKHGYKYLSINEKMFNNVKVEFHLICSALVDVLKTGNPSDKFFEKLTHFLR
jgi:hypothetical protein